jgi:tRNA pseudouridine38-40 synthase
LRLALLIEYDGTDFVGWQVQHNGRSVQGEITAGFQRLFQKEIHVHGAGRTDAGVHAHGMVAHVELPDDLSMTARKLTMALNAVTGLDVAIRDARCVPEDFHARFSATARQYRYTIKAERTAIDRNVVWAIKRAVDRVLIAEATALLFGEHDFTSFSKRTNDVEHYRCFVEEARWDWEVGTEVVSGPGTTFALTLRANRFVRGMVRALVGALVQVGQRVLSIEDFERLLNSPREIARAKYIAPAHGLVLEGVAYPEHLGLWQINESITS